MSEENQTMSFWEHFDVLRGYIMKILVAVLVFGVIAFCLKDILFQIVLAPKNPEFLTYRLFSVFGAETESFHVSLINTNLAEQFIIHMKMAFYVGFLCVSPYVVFMLFRFVAPALHSNERKYSIRIVVSAYLMFVFGVLISYFLVFPLTFRFLGTYQVSIEVENFISIASYVDTLIMLSFAMGLIFEMPVLSWILAKIGLINARFMKNYRRHAIVIIFVLAAVITPSADAFTMLIVALPLCCLYQLSIFIVKHTNNKVAA